jgi:hypothetical protein
MRTRPLTLMLMLMLAAACGHEVPQRSSPTPAPMPFRVLDTPVDDVRDGSPAWVDAETGRVMWLVNGAAVAVRDEDVRSRLDESSALRVFDDGSFLLQSREQLLAYPVTGLPMVVTFDQGQPAFDGVSVDDFWTLAFGRLCHYLNGGDPACQSLQRELDGANTFAVAPDGALYVSDGLASLFRVVDVTATQVSGYEFAVPRFRHGGDTTWLLSDKLYSVNETTAKVIAENVLDVAGSRDDYVFSQYDFEETQDNPICVILCATTRWWSQTVWYEMKDGAQSELGHLDEIDTGTVMGTSGQQVALLQSNKLFMLPR